MTNVKMNFTSSGRGPLTHEQLREMLAALSHEQWSSRWKSMFAKLGQVDVDEWLDHWIQDANMPYDLLSDTQKENRRAEADRVLKLLEEMGVWSGPGSTLYFSTPVYVGTEVVITGPQLVTLGVDPHICICENTAIHTPCPVHEPTKWEMFWGRKLPGQGDQ
jgi:hypothetical protein